MNAAESKRVEDFLTKGLPKNKEFRESKIEKESIEEEYPGNVGTDKRT